MPVSWGNPDVGEGSGIPRPTAQQAILAAAAALCYAVGYPLAIVAHWPVGWIFVTVGGILLMALAFVTIRRIHRSGQLDSIGPPSG